MTKKTTKDLYANASECCGCEMCAQICPKNVIRMKADTEGFLYPFIENNMDCIGCNLCQKVCPVKNAGAIHSTFRVAYAGWSKNQEQVISSSSGGAATALSEYFIKAGGIVYGVAYSSDCKRIEYVRASEVVDLMRLKTSKYAQATKAGVKEKIEIDLKAGRKVLFIGVPCDCAAIKRVFDKYENLIVVSLVCHGPTSPMVHEQYVSNLEKEKGTEVRRFSLRFKKQGMWKPYYIHADLADGSEFMERFDKSSYNKAFLFFKRPSCNSCVFKVDKFAADLLIGDYHAAKPGSDAYNINGVSSILVLTETGEKIVEEIKNQFLIQEVGMKISTHQIAINRPVKKRVNRGQFSATFERKGLESASNLPSVRIIEFYDDLLTNLKVTGVKIKKMIR